MRVLLPMLGCLAGCQLVFDYDGDRRIDAPQVVDPMDATDATDATDGQRPDASPPPPIPRLVAHYTLDENVDSTFPDETGNDHTARCNRCPNGVPGRVGGAMNFDGVAELAVVDAGLDLSPLGFTISFWVDLETTANNLRCVIGKPFGSADKNSWAGCFTNFVPFHASTNEDGMFDTTLGSMMVSPFGFHHIVLRWTGSQRQIFVDGTLAGESTVPGAIAFDDHPIVIGADENGGVAGAFFAGAIDEVKIFDGILTDEEILVLFATP